MIYLSARPGRADVAGIRKYLFLWQRRPAARPTLVKIIPRAILFISNKPRQLPRISEMRRGWPGGGSPVRTTDRPTNQPTADRPTTGGQTLVSATGENDIIDIQWSFSRLLL